MLPSGYEKSEHESYSSGSAFLANLTPPNKQSFKVKSKLKSRAYVSNSKTIKIFVFGGVTVCVFLL